MVTSHEPRQALTGLASQPTIVGIGPFDDADHAHLLVNAFAAVRRRYPVQLVLLGTGVHRVAVLRHVLAQGLGNSVHLIRHSKVRWSDVIAAADIVVPSPTTEPTTLLDVLALGRPVVAPATPATVRMIVPSSVGLVYRPDAASGMADALLRLLTKPELRHGMGCRATEVTRRYALQRILHQPQSGVHATPSIENPYSGTGSEARIRVGSRS
jgi:glycosyltransferase involved in cell wall biosynthesis